VAIVKRGFLRQASLRARRVASPANVLVSAREEDRSIWAGPLWFAQPANRFISDRGVPTSLSTAAAVLSIAARSPSCLVTILPSDFWVARESVLTDAIENALTALQRVPDTVATLGMSDTHPGTDEDYLIVGPGSSQMGAAIQAKANRPGPSAAKRLLDQGALVASGILLGHAQAFAARIHNYWPQLARVLIDTVGSDRSPEAEYRLSAGVCRHISRSVICPMRLFPPTFAMRAFRVQGSGWCSRKRLNDVQPASAFGLRASSSGRNTVRTDYPS
jgi:mannose-1-phosphate guanylyltransferase